jgi:hypothetical protein
VAKRIVPTHFRTLAFAIEGIPEGLSDEVIKAIVAASIKEATTKAAPLTAPTAPVAVAIKTPKLRDRNVRKKAIFACTYTESIGGKTIVGCGRTFSKERTLTAHMDHTAGIWADTGRFPHYCLDAIVTPELRDDR